MSSPAPRAGELLRPGLLSGVSILLAGAGGASSDARGLDSGAEVALREACVGLGARVADCEPGGAEEERLDAAVDAIVEQAGAIDLLAVDGAGLFAAALSAGGDGRAALRACLDGAWNATRATVNRAFLKAATPCGRIVYIAPSPTAGQHVEAARAGLENLARTLSIEWARHRITTVAIAPSADDEACAEVAALVAYLASPAGAYFSGCQLTCAAL